MTTRTGALAWSPDHPHAHDSTWTAPGGQQLVPMTWTWMPCRFCEAKTACVVAVFDAPVCDTCLAIYNLVDHQDRLAAVKALMAGPRTEENDRRMSGLFPCGCCCEDHTFADCLARVWGGCRSGLSYGACDWEDYEAWKRIYVRNGMKPEDF